MYPFFVVINRKGRRRIRFQVGEKFALFGFFGRGRCGNYFRVYCFRWLAGFLDCFGGVAGYRVTGDLLDNSVRGRGGCDKISNVGIIKEKGFFDKFFVACLIRNLCKVCDNAYKLNIGGG